MRRILHIAVTAALAGSLAACSGAKTDESAENTTPADAPATSTTSAAATPAVFAMCKSCHSPEKGKNMVGPSLFGVFGTKAGEVAGFNFSPAMKASGLTWDEATLDEYLAGPMKKVPGTKMTYAGQPDAAKRKELIEYIKSLK
ncbi:c-type cytochrome [Novosphingobium sp. SL115]|uniref:c-type cytochrome n=1 Tax=Novosphingobium sp. SL115 TaxID=2995150 RepID=UPI002276B073|nr:c-type cytochrome [Novosphingobium sp. SL115]MCY1670230.1 c-type cytochrome [Novosphingobium sp. SL115]